MKQTDIIIQFIKRIRRRLFFRMVLNNIVVGTIFGMILGIIINLAALLQPIYRNQYYVIPCIIFGILAAILVSLFQIPSMEKAALLGDSKALQEHLITAYESQKKEGRFYQLQREQTIQLISTYSIRHKFPIQLKKKSFVYLGLLFLLFIGSGLIPSSQKSIAEEKHEIKEMAKEEIANIEEAEKEIIQKSTPDTVGVEELKQAFDQVKKEITKSQSEEEISKAKERLEKKLEQTLSDSMDEDMINSLVELAASLDQMDYGDLMDILEQLQAEGILSESDLAKMESELSESQNNAVAYNNSNGSDSSGAASIGKKGSGSTGENGEGSNGDQSGEGAGSGSGSGSGNGSGSGSSNGSGSGNGSGGGWNYGSKDGTQGDGNLGEGSMVSIPNSNYEDSSLKGTATEMGDSTYTKSKDVLSWAGNPVEYSKVLSQYTQNAYRKISNKAYPQGVQDIIKQYFENLNQ